MRFIPKRPTLEEIVAAYGGLEPYLNDPEVITQNNGLGYRDIMLLFKESISAVARQTGRSKGHIYKLDKIRQKEAQHGNK